jgi:hypothetical protein
MRGVVVLVLLVAFLTSPASAAELTGNDLQEWCSAPKGSGLGLACATYISGFMDGIEIGDGAKRKDTRMLCFPDSATVGQARLIIEKYMRDNPQSLHQPRAIIVGKALLLAFPCKNSN